MRSVTTQQMMTLDVQLTALELLLDGPALILKMVSPPVCQFVETGDSFLQKHVMTVQLII